MKVRDREGAPKGGYDVVFKELVRPHNKVGLVGSGKEGKAKRAMIRLATGDDKITIPYSFPWDVKHPYFGSTMGALGVDPSKLGDLDNVEQALIKFEKLAQAKALACNVYVFEDGGFASSLKPLEGKFIAEFNRIGTRDDEGKGAPIHKHYVGDREYRDGGKEHIDEEQYRVELKILTGSRRGALLSKTLTYNIVKDEDDEWEIDAESSVRHAEAKRWMILHKTPLEKLSADKHFEDPENGLPELEALWLKHKRPLQVTVKNGFVGKIEEPAEGAGEVEDVGGPKMNADLGLIGELYDRIDEKVKKVTGKSAWLGDSVEFSKSGRLWVKKYLFPIMRRKELPLNFAKLNNEQVKSLLRALEK